MGKRSHNTEDTDPATDPAVESLANDGVVTPNPGTSTPESSPNDPTPKDRPSSEQAATEAAEATRRPVSVVLDKAFEPADSTAPNDARKANTGPAEDPAVTKAVQDAGRGVAPGSLAGAPGGALREGGASATVDDKPLATRGANRGAQAPSIGRIVLFWGGPGPDDEAPAIVTKAYADDEARIDAAVFHGSSTQGHQRIGYDNRSVDEGRTPGTWRWPPRV